MPGTIVETRTHPGPSELLAAPGSTYFVAGLAERGSVTKPVLVRSMAEYAERLGDRVSYGTLYDDLTTFFAEGGHRAYVARVVGAAATLGTRTLNDRAGTPVPTLQVDAASAGSWSTRVTVEVADGIDADTFDVVVRYDGAIVEAFRGLATPAAAVQAAAQSNWVRITNLSSASAAPTNNPAVSPATALSAGADDRAAVTAATVTTALERFDASLGAGAVATPGYPDSAVAAALIAHAKAQRRIALLAPAFGASTSTVKTAAAGHATTAGSEHAGLFYPWVQIPDGAGGARSISPEGYVAAVRARAHLEAGPWRAPAGEIAQARFITGLERLLTRAEGDDLNDSRVSAIRQVSGTFRLYGWRSLSPDTRNHRLLTGRDVLNALATAAEDLLEPFVFRAIDARGHLFNDLQTELESLVGPVALADGLYPRTDPETGEDLDAGYVIDTGPSVNTEASIAAGEIRAALSVRVAPTGELVRLIITKVSTDTPL